MESASVVSSLKRPKQRRHYGLITRALRGYVEQGMEMDKDGL